jgi:hypothetical protein
MPHPGELDRLIQQTFDVAFDAHAAGRLDEAERDYRLLLEPHDGKSREIIVVG